MMVAEKWISRWLESKQLTVDKNRCTHVKNHLSSCNRCVESCPASALKIAENLYVDFEKCVECMVCTTVCPTDVFTDKNYKKYLEQMNGRKVIEIACQRQAENNQGITIPCLRSLDKTMLLYALYQNKKIYIKYNEKKCKTCAYKFENISSVIEELIDKVRLINGSKTELYIYIDDKSVGEQQQFSRRELFSFFTNRIQSNIVLPLIEEEEVTNKEREKIILSQKRQLLKQVLLKDSANINPLLTVDNYNSAQIIIGERCTGCLKCAYVCPTGALFCEEDHEMMKIKQNLQACVNCRSCEDACENHELSLKNSKIEVSEFFNEKPQLVYRFNKKLCSCGETVSDNTKDLCVDCEIKQKQEEAFLSFW
ncbi:4Fe-4S binding protein [Calidifontibacillus oryziterrae]|uniref:4Fe-4S binding protein n=1 Tax=Calidifontibacillus oryziterrae TaxID=1191699 RepID=UPI000316B6D1|nr:4Fe-4S binding protein [Calidifontibacillus oryziterrae]